LSDLPILPEADDRPHRPESDDPLWQESSLFVWRDAKAGLAGFWRLGQEPNVAELNSCFGVFTDDGVRFRSNVTGAPMAADDRGEGHMGWGPQLRVDFDGDARIKADFPDCQAKLRFSDFHPRYDYIAMTGMRGQLGGAPHHIEVSGRMTGVVTLGGREIEIDALGYRDRSWGHRDWSTGRGTRWWPCVFGPDLALHVMHLVRPPGNIVKMGYVRRGEQVIPIVESDWVVGLESDGLTPRVGEARLGLENGETLRVTCDRVDGVVLHVRGYTAVETIGVARLEDGRTGMSNLEVCTNPTGGSNPPIFTIGSNNGEGLSRRPD